MLPRFLSLLALLVLPAVGQFKPVNETTYPQAVAAARGKVVLVNFWPLGVFLAARNCRSWSPWNSGSKPRDSNSSRLR